MKDILLETGGPKPSSEEWLKEAKQSDDSDKIGMYLVHNGVVRSTSKSSVYEGNPAKEVCGMLFTADKDKAEDAIKNTLLLDGVYYVRVWMADGKLAPGDDIMQVLIGADIRSHCVDALTSLVGKLKKNCVEEKEIK